MRSWIFLALIAAAACCGDKEVTREEAQTRTPETPPRSVEKTPAPAEDDTGFRYYSQFGQDKWILEWVFPGVLDGYYVDLGSWDGVATSNTKALDDRGWKGICVDPFPQNMESRTCKMFEEVVYSHPGKEIVFRTAGPYSGIDEHIGMRASDPVVQKADVVKLKTTTVDDILERAGAPEFIHFVSLDVEGAELEALKGLSFDKTRIGAFAIEHNNEEPKRTEIREHLEANGYRLALSVKVDDWYVLDDCRGGPESAACCMCGVNLQHPPEDEGGER